MPTAFFETTPVPQGGDAHVIDGNLAALLVDSTVRTVLVAATAMGVAGGALGSFTVLRRQSLLGDVLSHAALPGVVLAFMVTGSRTLGPLLVGAAITGALAAWSVTWMVRHGRLRMDTALGATLGLYFAVGVVLLSFVQGRARAGQAGLETFLFGQAAAVLRSDMWTMIGLAAVAIAAVTVAWTRWQVTTFDPDFAASIGVAVRRWEIAMITLVAVAVVVCLQMMGVVLTAAMLVAPAVAARQWTQRLGTMVVTSAAIGALGAAAGALVSAVTPGVSTGPVIVLLLTAIALLSLVVGPHGVLEDRGARRRWRRPPSSEPTS